jgi:hypothetical protein
LVLFDVGEAGAEKQHVAFLLAEMAGKIFGLVCGSGLLANFVQAYF